MTQNNQPMPNSNDQQSSPDQASTTRIEGALDTQVIFKEILSMPELSLLTTLGTVQLDTENIEDINGNPQCVIWFAVNENTEVGIDYMRQASMLKGYMERSPIPELKRVYKTRKGDSVVKIQAVVDLSAKGAAFSKELLIAMPQIARLAEENTSPRYADTIILSRGEDAQMLEQFLLKAVTMIASKSGRNFMNVYSEPTVLNARMNSLNCLVTLRELNEFNDRQRAKIDASKQES